MLAAKPTAPATGPAKRLKFVGSAVERLTVDRCEVAERAVEGSAKASLAMEALCVGKFAATTVAETTAITGACKRDIAPAETV